jgi:hypothetical protein
MPENPSTTRRVRLVGLISSAVAVVAIGTTVLAGNQTLGRQTITQSQQVFLLVAAAALFVVQAVLYAIHRYRSADTKSKRSDRSDGSRRSTL